MRSTKDLRPTSLPVDVSEAEGRGDVRLCVLGVSIRVRLFSLPAELERPLKDGESFRCGVNTVPDR